MDDKLIMAVQEMVEGKEKGFNTVYSATYNHVFFRAKACMKDDTDAQDLTQIVYIEAFKNIKSLQNAESLFGWLDGICYNQGMKLYRKKKEFLVGADEDGKDIFDTLESNDMSSYPELSSQEKETGRIIKKFVNELPEAQKAAVIAYYFDGFTVSEIAQMQGCTDGTVKSRLNYARKFLKEKVERTEKRDGIRLHTVALPTIWYAIKLLSESTKFSGRGAQSVYSKCCSELGVTPTSITTGAAGAGIPANIASSELGSFASVAGSVAGSGATASVVLKTLLIVGVSGLIVAGTGAAYVAATNNNNSSSAVDSSAEQNSDDSESDTTEPDESEEVSEKDQKGVEDETSFNVELATTGDSSEDEKSDDEIDLTDEEKIQIVDAIGFYSNCALSDDNYVKMLRLYAQNMHVVNPDGDKGFPWFESDKLSEQFVRQFYTSLGVEIPDEYDFDDYGITPDSDSELGEIDEDFYAYDSFDIQDNGDGTYSISGSFGWGALGDEPGDYTITEFTATAVKGGNPEIFGGLIIKECSVLDFSDMASNGEETSPYDTSFMADSASYMMNEYHCSGIDGALPEVYYFYDITNDGIPELLYVEGTCEADFTLCILKWSTAYYTWEYYGMAPGDHINNIWGKNNHSGIYISTVQMAYEIAYVFDYDKNQYERIYEGDCGINEDDSLTTYFAPPDSTVLTPYYDFSKDGIKKVLESVM